MTGVLRGALASALVAACGVLLVRLEAVSWHAVFAVLGGLLAVAIVAPIVASLARRNDLGIARIIDRSARTSDLLSSALAFSKWSTRDPMIDAVLRQAADASRGISVARLRPLASPVRQTTFLLAAALLALAWLFPLPAQSMTPADAPPSAVPQPLALTEEHEDLREEGRKLVERLKEEKDGTDERELGEKLDDLWAALDTDEADRDQVVENIARMANENVLTSGEQLEKLLEYLKRLAETMERAPELEKEAQEMAQGRTQPMADKMGQLAEKAGQGGLSENQQRQLGRAMKEGSDLPSQTSSDLTQALSDAAQGLDDSDLPQASAAMDRASRAMNNMDSRLSSLQRMSELMKHLSALKKMANPSTSGSGQLSESRFSMLTPSSMGNPTPGGQTRGQSGTPSTGSRNPSDAAAPSSGDDPQSGSDGVGTTPGGDGLGKRTRTPAPNEDSNVTGQLTGEGDIATVIYDSARFAGRAGAPYRRAHASAVDLLEASLSRERIPPGRSAMVREYFELIAPTGGARAD